MASIKELKDISNIIRRDSLEMTTSAGSGHPTSSMSCAEILSVLYFDEMSYDSKNPRNPDNDEFILSKGHASPGLYSVMYRAGLFKYNLNDLRKIGSPLEGHPKPSKKMPWIKVGTGSLGQGLSIGVGMALASKLQGRKFRTYVLMGDSESAEGSVYEAFELASHYKLNNLVAIIDVNRLGQRGETMVGHKIKDYKKRIHGFGWKVILVDGHNVKSLKSALSKARNSSKPTCIIAKTFKGKGVSFLENKDGWHGKAVPIEKLGAALGELPNPKMPKVSVRKPKKINFKFKKKALKLPRYSLGEEIASRGGYGDALASLALSDSSIIAVDGEVSNSTYSEKVKEKTPKQFVEAYIAEQNMIGMAQGLSVKGFKVYASSFAAFLSRAHDQIRMAGISSSDLVISGSHAGISIGEDGPSQMALEDLGMMRALPNSSVFYPSDAVSCAKLTARASGIKGIRYIRTTRAKTPVLYKNSESFPIGDFKVLRQSTKDKAVVVGAGITTHEAIKAYGEFHKAGKRVAVVDLYCIQPFNSKKFISFVKKHGKKVVIAEDHYQAGGIGEMLEEAVSNSGIKIKHLAVRKLPRSGKQDELLERYGISYKDIVRAVKSLK